MEEENLNKNELMRKIMEYKFAINDMALFLDTHPCNENALMKHNDAVKKYQEYKEKYETIYGPLSIDTEINSWENWVYDPWPWERSEN